jgi:hypothetical protein
MSTKQKLRKIEWHKWTNPWGLVKNKPEYTPEDELTWKDSYQEREEAEDLDIPLIMTPKGLLPIKPFIDPSKVFNFWNGETNFTISNSVGYLINKAEGVEIFEVFSKYKFRIAIGNLFTFDEVTENIEKVLNIGDYQTDSTTIKRNNKKISPELTEKIKETQTQLSKNYPFWAIYVLPNGKFDFATASSSNEEDINSFKNKVEVYKESREMAGGYLFEYDGEKI